MSISHLICLKSTCSGRKSKALITPFQALASSISSSTSSLLRSQSLSSPALRLAQVSLFPLRHTSFAHLFVSSLQIHRAFSQNSITKMPPIERPISGEKYDVVFIGGGSGGSAGSVCIIYVYSRSTTYCVLRSVAPRSMARRQPS
jgi:hypothetical protein